MGPRLIALSPTRRRPGLPGAPHHVRRTAQPAAPAALAHGLGQPALYGPGEILALQSASGNAAVARLIAQQRSAVATPTPAMQRQPLEKCPPKLDPRAICDELHLRADFWGSDGAEGSRLDTAFHNNRPLTAADNGSNVQKFQQALIQVGFNLPTFGADGNWGEETSGAVARFQAANGIPVGGFEAGRKTFLALDAHLGAGPGPKPPQPNPPQPNPPTPQPTDGAELETVLDRIDVAYQKMITRERDGVQAVCRDLSNLDQPKPSDLTQVIFFMLSVVSTFLYGFGEGALRQAIKKELDKIDALSEAVKFDLDNANDKVFDGMNDRFLKDLTQPPKGAEGRADLLADFCDAHLAAVTNAGFGAADNFEAEGKPLLRKGGQPQPPVLAPDNDQQPSGRPRGTHDPRNQSGDPRVDNALGMLDSINAVTNQAFQFHYDASLRAWDSQLAQAKLGKDKTNVEDTNLEPLKGSGTPGQGILRVLLEILSSPIEQVVDAKIDGLSPRTRKKLTGQTPAQAKLPVVADGSTGSRTMRVGVTEHGRAVDLTTSNSGAQFLINRGDGNREEGVQRVAKTVLNTPLPEIDSA